MYRSAADELAEKTLTFWRISRQWNGQSDANDITMDVALTVIGDSICETNPSRPLVKQMYMLQDELIHDECRPRLHVVSTPTPLRIQK